MYKPTKKGKRFRIWKCHVTMIKKGKNILIWKCNVTLARTKAVTYSSQIIVRLSFSKVNSRFSTTSILSCSPMAYNTIEPLGKLACTDYVDFGKCQDRFGQFSWSKNDSNYLDIKLQVLEREDKNAELRLRPNFSMGEADFNQFIRQRNQLVVAPDNFLREKKLYPFLQSTLSKDMEEQLKLVHKVIDVVDCSNRKVFVTMLSERWTTQRALMLKFVYSNGRMRTKSFNKFSMSTINLKNLYIFLTS